MKMDNDNLSIENRKNIQILMKLNVNYNCKACEYLGLYSSIAHTLCLNCKYSHSKDYLALKNRFSFCSSVEMRKRLKDMQDE